MLFLSFLYALALLTLGVLGLLGVSEPGGVRTLALPGLFFGGAVLFCSFFALKEPRHGLAGASFLAFLAFLTNSATLVGHLTSRTYDWSNPGHRLGTAIWAASLFYLLAAFLTWKRTRRAGAIAQLEKG